ncbi:hypothetical protein Q8F55_000085 [Vanrija albida]|uniref:Uncharacterized protein n=1 Tax=Vanrija albida TaxID=181172 RepID=A0ABR3QC98_9TREE
MPPRGKTPFRRGRASEEDSDSEGPTFVASTSSPRPYDERREQKEDEILANLTKKYMPPDPVGYRVLRRLSAAELKVRTADAYRNWKGVTEMDIILYMVLNVIERRNMARDHRGRAKHPLPPVDKYLWEAERTADILKAYKLINALYPVKDNHIDSEFEYVRDIAFSALKATFDNKHDFDGVWPEHGLPIPSTSYLCRDGFNLPF